MERMRKILPAVVLGLVGIVIWLERRAQAERQLATAPAETGLASSEVPEGTTAPDAAPSRHEADLYAAASAAPPVATEPEPSSEPAETPAWAASGEETAETESGEAAPASMDEVGTERTTEQASSAAAASETEAAEVTEPSDEADQAAPDMTPQGWVEGDGSRDCPPNFPIKGNANSMIYHQPGQSSYDVTIPEICFATEGDAQAAGYRPRRH